MARLEKSRILDFQQLQEQFETKRGQFYNMYLQIGHLGKSFINRNSFNFCRLGFLTTLFLNKQPEPFIQQNSQSGGMLT